MKLDRGFSQLDSNSYTILKNYKIVSNCALIHSIVIEDTIFENVFICVIYIDAMLKMKQTKAMKEQKNKTTQKQLKYSI